MIRSNSELPALHQRKSTQSDPPFRRLWLRQLHSSMSLPGLRPLFALEHRQAIHEQPATLRAAVVVESFRPGPTVGQSTFAPLPLQALPSPAPPVRRSLLPVRPDRVSHLQRFLAEVPPKLLLWLPAASAQPPSAMSCRRLSPTVSEVRHQIPCQSGPPAASPGRERMRAAADL